MRKIEIVDFLPFGEDDIVLLPLLLLLFLLGDHTTGDGIKMAMAIGADIKDITAVQVILSPPLSSPFPLPSSPLQVHPTGLVHPDEPEAKLKFLAAEALRGVGGILIDANGKRFCDELGRRDYVSESMMKNKGPFRLILGPGSAKEIEWHCKHYVVRFLSSPLSLLSSPPLLSSSLHFLPSSSSSSFPLFSFISNLIPSRAVAS